MKAILVIDIDDSLIEGDERFAIDGYLTQESDCIGCYEAVGRIRNAVLKPMPEKYLERDITIETERDVEMCTHGITIGRNVLIDEILGVTE